MLDVKNMTEEELVKLSCERGGKYNNYTADAISAQRELQTRKGGFQRKYSNAPRAKVDRSYYSDMYY